VIVPLVGSSNEASWLALLIACVVVGGACGEVGESSSESTASVPANSPSSPPVEDELPRLSAWVERLQGAKRVAEYGRLDETDLDYVPGEVAAVEIDRVGNVLVLDEKYHDVRRRAIEFSRSCGANRKPNLAASARAGVHGVL
jgi:hypothetical protein